MGLLDRLRAFYSHSFRRKLLIFNLSAVFLTATVLTVFLLNNFRSITNYALEQNKASTEQSINEFLDRFAQEKATLTWLQLQAAQNNLTVLGKTAQKLVDNRAAIRANPAILELPLFATELQDQGGALTSPADAAFDAFIPPPIAANPEARELLAESALLNLSMDAVYQANLNNAFIYFVGDQGAPVTRAYPNIHLVDALGEGVSQLFWKDYFAPNVANWTRWYSDPALREQFPSPVTVEPPYADAAGQGLVVSMFYPLWDAENNRFAGAVGADITLNNIIENVLSFKVANTGFAFLMNGQGEVIAMPETGFQQFGIDLTEARQGSLIYYRGALASSSDPAVQQMAATIGSNEKGLLKVDLRGPDGQLRREIISYASLPPLTSNTYEQDRWKIVVAVPEAEVFEALNATDAAINAERTRQVFFSLGLVLAFLIVVTAISVRVSTTTTRDLRTLARAAEGIAAKDYAVDIQLQSSDEIGQLGSTFTGMAREIREYTINLEAKVAERTADLQRANSEISRLNEQLRGENLRLGAELDVARRIQMMVLPPDQEIQSVLELDIACFMRPADEVGGDYYDVLQADDAVYLGIGDVTGHGLPAGIIMLMAQTAFLTLSQSGERDMQRVILVLNSVLYRNIERIQEDKNMTLAVLEYRQREFTIVGQHESVIICRTNGEIEVIDTLDLGLPMGLEEDITGFVSARQVRLEPDDVMLLYTDGVTEAENEGRQQFGMQSLASSLVNSRHLCANDIRNRVMEDVYAFIGETRIYDDISLLVVKQR
jgi:sigma-B regulation protein RsbU (phosphoserine phosphatase)